MKSRVGSNMARTSLSPAFCEAARVSSRIAEEGFPLTSVRADRLPELTQPVEHETADRIITGLVTALPMLFLIVAAWQVWDKALHWRDLEVLAGVYLATGLG